MKPVKIKWRDSVTLQGWRFAEDMKDFNCPVITTIGYVVTETKKDVVVAMSKGRNDDFCNWTSIPTNMIVSRKVLK